MRIQTLYSLFCFTAGLLLMPFPAVAQPPSTQRETRSTTTKDLEDLVTSLEEIHSAEPRRFQLRDNEGNSMDCLKVFQPTPGSDVYGVYHARLGGELAVFLAISEKDITKWRKLRVLDDHASQATIHVSMGGGLLVAYEKAAPNSVWIRLRYYSDLEALSGGEFSNEFDVPRSLAPTAEGTPSFESVKIKNGDPTKSEIQLRFHYFRNVRVDQLAEGTLTDFKDWESASLDQLNKAIVRKGGLGNIGDRDRFTWRGKAYYLQEVQLKRLDWSAWRIFLCDSEGAPLQQLTLQTPGGSTTFSNPTATLVRDESGRERLLVTHYLHRAGSGPSEAGALLYVIDSE